MKKNKTILALGTKAFSSGDISPVWLYFTLLRPLMIRTRFVVFKYVLSKPINAWGNIADSHSTTTTECTNIDSMLCYLFVIP